MFFLVIEYGHAMPCHALTESIVKLQPNNRALSETTAIVPLIDPCSATAVGGFETETSDPSK